jgi:hypothetical protein
MSSLRPCFFLVRHRRQLPPAVSGPHDDPAAPCKELRAAADDAHQLEREHQASRQARGPIAQPVRREENRREVGAKHDEGAGEHRERKHRCGIEVGFRHPNGFHTRRHLGRGGCVQVERMIAHCGLPARLPLCSTSRRLAATRPLDAPPLPGASRRAPAQCYRQS